MSFFGFVRGKLRYLIQIHNDHTGPLRISSVIAGAYPVTPFRQVTGPVLSQVMLYGAFITFVILFGEFTAT